MPNTKLSKLLVRQAAIKDAIRAEARVVKSRKQKALFNAARRAGLLDVADDELEEALRAFSDSRVEHPNSSESQK